MDLFAKRGSEIDDYADNVLGSLEMQDVHSLCTSTGEVWSRFCLVNNAGVELPNKGVREALEAVQRKVAELSAKLPSIRVNVTKCACRRPTRVASIPLSEVTNTKVWYAPVEARLLASSGYSVCIVMCEINQYTMLA